MLIDIETITNKLMKNGYTNKLINYKEFLELYNTYKTEMAEKEFAEILGISYTNYNNIKSKGTRTKILKQENKIEDSKKEKIREEFKEKGYANKLIDYKEFLELYESYKNEMIETKFAEILGISYYNYINIKCKNIKTKILKEVNKIENSKKEEIREEFKEKGYTNKLIDYKEFLELYEPYKKDMLELEFAEILGVSYGNYNNIKNKGTRAKILKSTLIIEDSKKEEIREKFKEKGYTNKLIDYKEFLELYESYKNEMKETKFAEILGISYTNYSNIKNKGTRAKILKSTLIIEDSKKEEIREKFKEKGYTNKLIDYKEFLELYESYKNEMKELEFAEILGISYPNYNNIRNNGRRTIILRIKSHIDQTSKEKIIKTLKENGYSNKLIDYTEFLELYEPYKNKMKELEFAEILGISYPNYMHIKNMGTSRRIKFKVKEINKIKYQLGLESREYKIEEIKAICEKYNITLFEILSELYPSMDITKLMTRKTIYIGTCPVPKDFLKRNSQKLLQTAQMISKKMSQKYKKRMNMEDISSTVLLNVMEKKGNLIINTETDEEALDIITKYMAKSIKYQYISSFTTRGTISLDAHISQDENRKIYDIVKAPDKDVETEVELKLAKTEEDNIKDSENTIIEDMRNCYQDGMKNEEAIMHIRKKYGISRKELLEILEEELSKRRKIIKTETDKVYLGEELDD